MAVESRGRPKEPETIAKEKWELVCHEVPSRPELGFTTTFYFDRDKCENGAWKVESKSPKGWKEPKSQLEKAKTYCKQPVVMVFKTSNRLNAKVKIKTWKNKNIDQVLEEDLVGVPKNAEILELAVGESFIQKYKLKYKL